MVPNRPVRQPVAMNNTPGAIELLRQASEPKQGSKETDKEENKIPIFWRIFGGTLLSISFLLTMSAYQSLAGGLTEIRQQMGHLSTDLHKEITRFSEAQAGLISKEEAASGIRSVFTSIKELQEDRKELTKLKERCQAIQTQVKAAESHRQELQMEIHQIREQHAAEQERRALVNELSALRERLTGLEASKQAPRRPRMQRID